MTYHQIIINRHQEPKKDPATGSSLDALTEQGYQNAVAQGKALDVSGFSKIYGVHSPKVRANQTLKGIYEGAGLESAISVNQLLDTAPSVPGLKEKMAQRKSSGNPMSYDEVVMAYWGHKLENGRSILAESGGDLAQYVLQQIETRKSDGKALTISISHGPKVEAGVAALLGYTHVSEIGGGFKPGEGYKVHVEEKNGKYSIVVEYRGQKHNISLDKVKEVASKQADAKKAGSEKAEAAEEASDGKGGEKASAEA